MPCILAIPCFYIAGVQYSWHKYHEAVFMLDVFGEMEQFYQDQITRKRFIQLTGDPAEKSVNYSADIDWKVTNLQRKMKLQDLKRVVDIKVKLKVINSRNNTFQSFQDREEHNYQNKQPTLVGVLPEDLSKKQFVLLSNNESSR